MAKLALDKPMLPAAPSPAATIGAAAPPVAAVTAMPVAAVPIAPIAAVTVPIALAVISVFTSCVVKSKLAVFISSILLLDALSSKFCCVTLFL